MMSRNGWLAVGAAALLVVSACDSADEGSGGSATGTPSGSGGSPTGTPSGIGGSPTGTTTGSGGAGGSSCLTCNEWLVLCGAGACPDPQAVCGGPSQQALVGLGECLCAPTGGGCAEQCPATCGGTGQDLPGCEVCVAAALEDDCTGEVNDCANN